MGKYPKWQYNEFEQVGVNYSNCGQAEIYDTRMQPVQDSVLEAETIISELELDSSNTIIDLGAGTGTFSILAAKCCSWVYAVDVSEAMLNVARMKAKEEKLTNISFHRAGFLTYEHSGEPVDAVVSQIALHHLPDLWKSIALHRVANMLKASGKFYLKDVVFSFAAPDYEAYFSQLLRNTPAILVDEFETHIREEYSTLDWVIEGLLQRAGFVIEKAQYREGFWAHYLCYKATGFPKND